MNKAPALTVGNRVRVTMEGVVRQIDADGEVFLNGEGNYNSFYPNREAVVAVEIITPPLKVGDIGQAASLNPPTGAVLLSSRSSYHILVVNDGQYVSSVTTRQEPLSYLTDTYEVVYLPEVTS